MRKESMACHTGPSRRDAALVPDPPPPTNPQAAILRRLRRDGPTPADEFHKKALDFLYRQDRICLVPGHSNAVVVITEGGRLALSTWEQSFRPCAHPRGPKHGGSPGLPCGRLPTSPDESGEPRCANHSPASLARHQGQRERVAGMGRGA